jgi:sugar phosphate isomerase/epimerase
MKLTFPNVPIEALQEMAQELRRFGVQVAFEASGSRGHITCPSGVLRFDHADDIFTVVILQDEGHFTRPLLIGGFRQFVEEACERLQHRMVKA